MTPKQQRLIKDIATLFVKYDVKDMEIVFDSLSNLQSATKTDLRGLIIEFAQQAGSIKSTSRSAKRKSAKPGKEKTKQLSKRLINLRNALISKEIFGGQIELRRFAVAIGLKENLPSQRSEAVARIIAHLSGKTDAHVRDILKRASALSSPKANFDDEFARWAAIILNAEDR